jgi:hypothetical protein
MRTKTLLIAAAALAAGILSSSAQTYSQNVVGYINVTVPTGAHQFQFIANQLQTVTTNGTNNIQDVFGASTLGSDPNGILNTVLYDWNGSGYTPYFYYNASDSGYNQAGFYDNGGNYANSAILNQGSGAFIQNPGAAPLTVTFTGNVIQGTNVLSIKPGFNALSIIEPVSTNIDSTLCGFVGTSDPNGLNNDVLYIFNNGWTPLFYYNASDSGYNQAGFYDNGGNYQSANPAYFPTVGAAFMIQHLVNTTTTWTNKFSVQ